MDTTDGIRLDVLGTVRVTRDGTETGLERRPRLMLALLLARAGQTVGVSEVIDLLWGAAPPANAINMVRRYVGAIRRAIEPGLPFRAEGSWLAGVPGGYRLRAGPDSADVLEFRALAGRARAAAGAAASPAANPATNPAASPAAAVADWVAALSLWRGPYADGLIVSGPVPAAFAAVDEERASAARTASRAGDPGAVLPLVRAVAEANPLDESLAAEVIRLLTEQGRAAEAASWYRRTRDMLDEHLGVSPGPALATALDPSARTPRPAQLPSDPRLFGGRRDEVAAMTAAVQRFAGTAGVIAIDGIPGSGKPKPEI